ncbi:hypothetical protein Csa_019604, partial [Cucumis sativus]
MGNLEEMKNYGDIKRGVDDDLRMYFWVATKNGWGFWNYTERQKGSIESVGIQWLSAPVMAALKLVVGFIYLKRRNG